MANKVLLPDNVILRIAELGDVETALNMCYIEGYIGDLVNVHGMSIVRGMLREIGTEFPSVWAEVVKRWPGSGPDSFPSGKEHNSAMIHHFPVTALVGGKDKVGLIATRVNAETVACVPVASSRDSEIDMMLISKWMRITPGPGPGNAIPWPQSCARTRPLLRAILKRAMYTCDRISDIPANVIIPDVPEAHPKVFGSERTESKILRLMTLGARDDDPDLVYCLQCLGKVVGGPQQVQDRLATVNNLNERIFDLQKKFIAKLSTEDLCGLHLLLQIVGYSWGNVKRLNGRVLTPTDIDTRNGFVDTVLTHGVYPLFGHIRGFRERAECAHGMHTDRILLNIAWETTHPTPIFRAKPLRLVFVDELRSRFPSADTNWADAAFKFLDEKLQAPESTGPHSVFVAYASVPGYGDNICE